MGEMLQPRRFGGQEMPAAEFLGAVAALAARDGAAAWRCASANAAAYRAGLLPDHAGARIWGDDADARVAVAWSAGGRLGGGRLTGHWSDVTGVDVADWLLLAAAEDGAEKLVLVARAEVTVTVVADGWAGLADLTVSGRPVGSEAVFPAGDDSAVLAGAAAAAAVAGAADGLWRAHVARVRQRLAASYGSAEIGDMTESTRQVARAAADIDAATLQAVASLSQDPAAAARAQAQAAARARDAADRVLGSSRGHALDAADPVAGLWRDVHTGCRLTLALLDGR